MVGLRHAVRLAGLALTRPVEFADRLAGCCQEVAEVRAQVLGRLTGTHHHDGGTLLAELLWVLVRHRRPAVVVETGVARGVSSAFILDALERNGHGRLWSVDLPPVTPDWGDQTGMAVAPEVRERWTYVRGAARRKLPKVLSQCGPVGIFVHDGLHTAENMLFEMRQVWPHLEPDGLVVSDDADDNHAVLTFAGETGVEPILLREPAKSDVVAIIRHP
jgi:Methyltransferase domain